MLLGRFIIPADDAGGGMTARIVALALNETLDELSGEASGEISDPDGSVVLTASFTFQATRIAVEPPQ